MAVSSLHPSKSYPSRRARHYGQPCSRCSSPKLQQSFAELCSPCVLRELRLYGGIGRVFGGKRAAIEQCMSLAADSAAILDQGNSMAIWLGREVAAAMPDPSGDGRWTRTTLVCERHATRLAAGRFPMPEVITATEVHLSDSRPSRIEHNGSGIRNSCRVRGVLWREVCTVLFRDTLFWPFDLLCPH